MQRQTLVAANFPRGTYRLHAIKLIVLASQVDLERPRVLAHSFGIQRSKVSVEPEVKMMHLYFCFTIVLLCAPGHEGGARLLLQQRLQLRGSCLSALGAVQGAGPQICLRHQLL